MTEQIAGNREVVQADRNAAIRLLEAGGQDWQAKEIRIGNGDHFPIVQAFRDHRLAAQPVTDNDVWFTATVSEDGQTIGIDHPTEADWFKVRRAHEVLRDRLNERLGAQNSCPVKPNTVASPGYECAEPHFLADPYNGYEAGLAEGRREVEQQIVAFINRYHFWQGSYDCSDAHTKEWLADAISRGDYRPTTEGESGK